MFCIRGGKSARSHTAASQEALSYGRKKRGKEKRKGKTKGRSGETDTRKIAKTIYEKLNLGAAS